MTAILNDKILTTHNLFFFYGEDTYSLKKIVKKIIKFHLNDDLKDFNFSSFNEDNYSDQTIESVSNELHSLPIMAEKRVVVLSNADKFNQKIQDLITLFIKKNIDTSVLIIAATKPDKRKVFYKNLIKNKNILSLEFKQKKDFEIANWIKNYLGEQNKNISNNALRMFMLNVSSNLNNITSELDKILTFSKNETISEDDIEETIGISKEYNIFKLQEFIIKRDNSKSLNILQNILISKNSTMEPIGINLMLSKLFIAAFEIKSESAKTKVSVENAAVKLGYTNPWKDKEKISCAKNYSLKELLRIMRYFLECDIKLKSSYQNKDIAITLTVEKIINHGNNSDCKYLNFFNTLTN